MPQWLGLDSSRGQDFLAPLLQVQVTRKASLRDTVPENLTCRLLLRAAASASLKASFATELLGLIFT